MINQYILLYGAAGFLLALFIHIIIWRIIHPNHQMIWLGIIFFIIPLICYLILLIFGEIFLPLAYTFIWQIALSAAYIMTYPAIQAGCPSLKIILILSEAKMAGLSREGIKSRLPDFTLFSHRFNDLTTEGLIIRRGNLWILSKSARITARGFLIYRRILKMPMGEG
jgi:hypothetical protein